MRIYKKMSSENVKHVQQAAWKRKFEQAPDDGNANNQANRPEAPETNGSPLKRTRIRVKTSAINTYYSCFTRSKAAFNNLTESDTKDSLGSRAR